MLLIEASDFAIGNDIDILALQGDWDLTNKVGPAGGKWVIADPARAHEACLTFMDRLAVSGAHIAMVPELAIPRSTVMPIITAIRAMPRSVVFLGGVEGQTRLEYESLVEPADGETQALVAGAPENYINALLIVVKSPKVCRVYMRAKRIPSGEENKGPPMARGAGPFVTIKLGLQPLVIVPLVCSEFVWPDELWGHLDKDVSEEIDLIPVLQHNKDVESKHTSPQLHHGYTRPRTKQTRFVFVNQAISPSCDGACYVVVPPKSPNPPNFDHSRNELWELPAGATYKGFRIPDLTGCIWSARITTPQAPSNALGMPFCEGRVREVLSPAAAQLRGLPVGLMRSAAVLIQTAKRAVPHSKVRDLVLSALDRKEDSYILRLLDTDSAKDVFYRMQNGTPIEWAAVQDIVGGLVEGAALLASGGDNAAVIPCEAGNCQLAGRSLLALYAPDVDEAISKRFSISDDLDGTSPPAGVLLIGIQSGSSFVGAHRIGDILRADRVTTTSDDLAGSPRKTEDSSATIRLAEVEFRPLEDLKPNWKLATSAEARTRLRDLFPKVYAI